MRVELRVALMAATTPEGKQRPNMHESGKRPATQQSGRRPTALEATKWSSKWAPIGVPTDDATTAVAADAIAYRCAYCL